MPDEAAPASVATTLARFPDRGAQREALKHDRNAEHGERHNGRRELLRVQDALDALVTGEHRTDDEQHYGNEEGVKVALGPEAKRVLLRLRPFRPGATQQQQHLVARVGDGVHGLSQH